MFNPLPPQQKCDDPILLLCIRPGQGGNFAEIDRNVQIQGNLQKCAWDWFYL